MAKDAAIGGAAGVGTALGTAGTVSALGFTTSGIAAGSAAAGAQSVIGSVAAGSAFAGLQSIGATGLLMSAPVVGVAALAGLGAAGVVHLARKISSTKE